MKKDKKKNKACYICVGVLLFIVIAAAAIASVKIIQKIRYNARYGEIIELAEKHGLDIISIEYSEASGAEIYISRKAVNSAVMEKYYCFGQELSGYLNGRGDVFGNDKSPVPVRLTFGGVEKQPASHDTAAVCRPAPGDSKYEFTEYHIRFETGFEGISYIKNAKRLYLLRGKLSDLKGIENFAGLEYLYADVDENKREELEKKLPDCETELVNNEQ